MDLYQEKIEPNVSNSSGTDQPYVWVNGNRRQSQFNSIWRYLGGVTRKAHRRWLIHHPSCRINKHVIYSVNTQNERQLTVLPRNAFPKAAAALPISAIQYDLSS
jgi:hypothetical protein